MANFYGTDIDDVKYGGADRYYGGGGSDYMYGDIAETDTLYGGDGIDVIMGKLTPHT